MISSDSTLVHVKVCGLILPSPDCLVLSLADNPSNPGRECCSNAESCRTRHGNEIPGLIAARPEIRRPDEGDVHNHGHDTDGHGLLLFCLATDAAAPSQNERVDSVGTNSENYHGHVSACKVQSSAGGHEPDGGYSLGCCNMPCPFIELPGRPGD